MTVITVYFILSMFHFFLTYFHLFFRISYLEIYNETMFDLLSTVPETWNQNEPEQNKMVIVENQDGIYVKGLSCHLVQTEEEALNLLFEVN